MFGFYKKVFKLIDALLHVPEPALGYSPLVGTIDKALHVCLAERVQGGFDFL